MGVSQIRVSYDWSSFDHFPITAGLGISTESFPLPVMNKSSSISSEEIMPAIKQLKDGRGFDGIEYKHFKSSKNFTVIYLKRFITLAFATVTFHRLCS